MVYLTLGTEVEVVHCLYVPPALLHSWWVTFLFMALHGCHPLAAVLVARQQLKHYLKNLRIFGQTATVSVPIILPVLLALFLGPKLYKKASSAYPYLLQKYFLLAGMPAEM